MKATLHKVSAVNSIVLMVVSLGFMSGCVTTQKRSVADSGERPDWLLNTPIEQGSLYGVGSAEIFAGNDVAALNRAKDFARIELIKQIEVDISGSVEQEISEAVLNNTTTLTQNLSQTVSSKVPEFKLSNVLAVDSFHDKKNNQVASLVRLDVNKERAALARQIASIDLELMGVAEQLDKMSAGGMSRLRLVSPALVLADQRAGLQARLNQLEMGLRVSPLLPDDVKALVAKIYQMIAELKVSIAAEGEIVRALQTALIAQLSNKGVVISDSEKSDIEILYSLRSNTITRGDTVFVFTEGDVWIKDEMGRTVTAFKAKAKGTSADSRLAHTRSIEKLSNQLSSELLDSLFK